MNEHGRAAVVLDTGAVTRGSGSKNEDKERNIRKWFVDRDLIDGVILLRQRVQKGRPKNFIPDGDIRPLAAMFLKGEPVDGEIAVITREQAAEADYNLSPSRWVGPVSSQAQGEVGELARRLEILSAEQVQLDAHVFALLRPLIAEAQDVAAE
jgi:type I restriction enzyme M protein